MKIWFNILKTLETQIWGIPPKTLAFELRFLQLLIYAHGFSGNSSIHTFSLFSVIVFRVFQSQLITLSWIAMTQLAAENTENSLEKIKRQLASASGRNLLQGPLLKRSETVLHALPFSQYQFLISRFNFTLFSPLLLFFPNSNCYFFLTRCFNHYNVTITMCSVLLFAL